ncbi:methanol dehydrogenase [cytochrome c] subunit [Pollutimonas bauzanensis]|uniref:Methanol dehydrogenase [cytochrome c] subunit 2 n=1 Tax=Pollutimonas bauzanensis TaxID=658167 RepID=A0A1M5M7K9_9BURK|nr:methanol dehydrogenase [cytochrome c] subunit [Pollutimonas bauzanensis]SHG73284.1 methanol dehydrogenase (cytochrome) small subunit [Pollutimonas bauzanensis]
MILRILRPAAVLAGASIMAFAAMNAQAYDGTKCKAPGNCWEPKPGYPQQVAGSKYDPKHNPKEVAKQQDTIQQMEDRNKQRVEHFKKSGVFIYDVKKIPKS